MDERELGGGNMKFIIAIDPGNKTGLVYGYDCLTPRIELCDFTPKSATKKRAADEKHIRYGSLWNKLQRTILPVPNIESVHVICENAAGFMKGKSAVEVSNKYRGVVEAFCAVHEIQYTAIQPNDLQRWATGKGKAEKSEMIKVATDRYGFTGTDDNQADALLMWHFLKEQLTR